MASPRMSQAELALLGDGEVGYVKVLSSDEVETLFPNVEGLPKGMNLYLLASADGTPIVLTDTIRAALGHAISDELIVQSLH